MSSRPNPSSSTDMPHLEGMVYDPVRKRYFKAPDIGRTLEDPFSSSSTATSGSFHKRRPHRHRHRHRHRHPDNLSSTNSKISPSCFSLLRDSETARRNPSYTDIMISRMVEDGTMKNGRLIDDNDFEHCEHGSHTLTLKKDIWPCKRRIRILAPSNPNSTCHCYIFTSNDRNDGSGGEIVTVSRTYTFSEIGMLSLSAPLSRNNNNINHHRFHHRRNHNRYHLNGPVRRTNKIFSTSLLEINVLASTKNGLRIAFDRPLRTVSGAGGGSSVYHNNDNTIYRDFVGIINGWRIEPEPIRRESLGLQIRQTREQVEEQNRHFYHDRSDITVMTWTNEGVYNESFLICGHRNGCLRLIDFRENYKSLNRQINIFNILRPTTTSNNNNNNNINNNLTNHQHRDNRSSLTSAIGIESIAHISCIDGNPYEIIISRLGNNPNQNLATWDIRNLKQGPASIFLDHVNAYRSIPFDIAAGILAAPGDDGCVRFWDVKRAGKPVGSIPFSINVDDVRIGTVDERGSWVGGLYVKTVTGAFVYGLKNQQQLRSDDISD